jgi:hypothetical protein
MTLPPGDASAGATGGRDHHGVLAHHSARRVGGVGGDQSSMHHATHARHVIYCEINPLY